MVGLARRYRCLHGLCLGLQGERYTYRLRYRRCCPRRLVGPFGHPEEPVHGPSTLTRHASPQFDLFLGTLLAPFRGPCDRVDPDTIRRLLVVFLDPLHHSYPLGHR